MTDEILDAAGRAQHDTNGTEPGEAVEPSGDAAPPPGEAAPPPGELTEGQLEALLFVAERPLSRREIASLAGVDRATVDARLGDLEVSLAARGIRLVLSGRSRRARDHA